MQLYQLVFTLCFLTLFSVLKAQPNTDLLSALTYEVVIPCESPITLTYEFNDYDYPHYQFKEAGKWGLLDRQLQVILPAQYDSIDSQLLLFKEEIDQHTIIFAAQKNTQGKLVWGTLQLQNQAWICAPQFDRISLASDFRIYPIKGEKRGYVNAQGQLIYAPLYDWISPYEQLATFRNESKKWGMINQQGDTLILPQYKYIGINGRTRGNIVIVKAEGTTKESWCLAHKAQGTLITSLQKLDDDCSRTPSSLGKIKINHQLAYATRDSLLIPPNEQYKEIKNLQNNRFAIQNQTGKWGFFEAGKQLTPFQYDQIDFHRYHYPFYQNKKAGLLDSLGQEIIPAIYQKIQPFFSDTFMVKQNNLMGFINSQQEFITPLQYSYIDWQYDDRTFIVSKHLLWGLLDEQLQEVVPLLAQHRSLLEFEKGDTIAITLPDELQFFDLETGIPTFTSYKIRPLQYNRQEGLYVFEHAGLAGIFDPATGKVLVPAKFPLIQTTGFPYISNNPLNLLNYALVQNEAGKQGAITLSGEMIIPPQYDQLKTWAIQLSKSPNGEIPTLKNHHILAQKEAFYGIIDTLEQVLLPFEYQQLRYASPLIHHYQKDNQWGIFSFDKTNSKYQILCTAQYDQIRIADSSFHFSPVQKSGKWGYIDASGKQVIPCLYDSVSLFKGNGYALAFQRGKKVLLDLKGAIITSPHHPAITPAIFQESFFFNDRFSQAIKLNANYFAVSNKEGAWGIANKKGELVLKHEYRKPQKISSQIVSLRPIGSYILTANVHLFDLTTGDYAHFPVQEIERLTSDLLLIRKKNMHGLMDTTGQILLEPAHYRRITRINEHYLFIRENGSTIGILNHQGDTILPTTFHDSFIKITDQKHLIYRDRESNQFGIINAQGEQVITPQYDHIMSFGVDSFLVYQQARYHVINIQNEILEANVPDTYRWKKSKGNQILIKGANFKIAKHLQVLEKEGRFGLQNKAGKLLIPPTFDEYRSFPTPHFRNFNRKMYLNTSGKVIQQE